VAIVPVYAPAPRSFFVFSQRLVCVVRAADEKAGEKCRSVFANNDSEVERGWKKDWLKKGVEIPHKIHTSPAFRKPGKACAG
jgi:hypothetical protein